MVETVTTYGITYDERTALLDEDDDIQHGIDDDPNGDAEKGAAAGAIGGAIVGAAAGAIMGPGGAIVGALAGGVVGGVASGSAVAWIDRHDNDNNISGIGGGTNYSDRDEEYPNSSDADSGYMSVIPAAGIYMPTVGIGVPGVVLMPDHEYDLDDVSSGAWEDGGVPSFATARVGYAGATSGLDGETVPIHGNTYATTSAANSGIGTGFSKETELGEETASFKTGGVANDGTPDTRGIGEKIIDGLTGDDVDDKTGKIVNHP